MNDKLVIRRLYPEARGVGAIRLTVNDAGIHARRRIYFDFPAYAWPSYLSTPGEISWTGIGFDIDNIPHIMWGPRDEVVSTLRQHGYDVVVTDGQA